MARARNIKPGFFKNERLAELSPHARLLFAGLWMLADREGRLEDRPKRIKAEIFPYETVNIDRLLDALATADFIRRYTYGGCSYLYIPSWKKHQNPHKNEGSSTLPVPDSNGSAPEIFASSTDKIGSAPADSLIPSSLIPDSLNPQPSNRDLTRDRLPEVLEQRWRELWAMDPYGTSEGPAKAKFFELMAVAVDPDGNSLSLLTKRKAWLQYCLAIDSKALGTLKWLDSGDCWKNPPEPKKRPVPKSKLDLLMESI